jgi:hypothetical protein
MQFVKNSSLSLFFLTIFLLSVVFQAVVGQRLFNEDEITHAELLDDTAHTVSFWDYVFSSHFGQALMENWQSEYLQFFLFVLDGSEQGRPPTGDLRAIVGTMGGDRQPQVLVQLLASILWTDQDPAATLAAGRWGLSSGLDQPGFGTWTSPGDPVVEIEKQAPAEWFEGLASRGHRVRRRGRLDPEFGQAQIIRVDDDGYVGAADPRSTIGAAGGW